MQESARLIGAQDGPAITTDAATTTSPQALPVATNTAGVPGMNFSAALDVLKSGELVARDGWNGKGMHVGLRVPSEAGQLPYLYMLTAQGGIVPWVASHTDLLADDWVLA